jgi:RimJ/RimL family protein N-acetyltransferase
MADLGTASATLRAVKAGEALVLEVGHPVVAVVRPVRTERSGSLDIDARLVTAWRNRHRSAFLTEFQAEPERTQTWLREVVEPDPRRLLFMLEDLDGHAFGHVGLNRIDLALHSAELDSVVRGEPAARGVMAACITALAGWASAELGITHLSLRVRSDNPAVSFYERIGFSRNRRVPLRSESCGSEVRWLEDPDAVGGIGVIYMDYQWPAEEGERTDGSRQAP